MSVAAYYMYTIQPRDIEPMLVQRWPAVYDVGPTLTRQWFNVSCLVEYLLFICRHSAWRLSKCIQQLVNDK